MKNVLFISAHYPSRKSKYAGHKIAFQNLMVYDESDNVDLIIISNADEKDDALLSAMKNTKLVLYEPLTTINKIKNIVMSKKIFPLKVMSRYSYKVNEYIIKHIAKYDIVHFEFTHAGVMALINKRELVNTNINVCSHDILIQSKLRRTRKNIITKIIDAYDVPATFDYENELYQLANKIQVLSLKDKMLVEALYSVSDSKIEIIEPIISEFVENVRKSRGIETIKPKTLLFWGAMDRKENEEAIVNFLGKFEHELLQKGYIVYVVGNNPSSRVRKMASRNVVVTGFVEDPSPYFQNCQIGIVPLLSGAGIKIKTLEMLRSGLPVVSTPIGSEGISNKNLHTVQIDQFLETVEKINAKQGIQ